MHNANKNYINDTKITLLCIPELFNYTHKPTVVSVCVSAVFS